MYQLIELRTTILLNENKLHLTSVDATLNEPWERREKLYKISLTKLFIAYLMINHLQKSWRILKRNKMKFWAERMSFWLPSLFFLNWSFIVQRRPEDTKKQSKTNCWSDKQTNKDCLLSLLPTVFKSKCFRDSTVGFKIVRWNENALDSTHVLIIFFISRSSTKIAIQKNQQIRESDKSESLTIHVPHSAYLSIQFSAGRISFLFAGDTSDIKPKNVEENISGS